MKNFLKLFAVIIIVIVTSTLFPTFLADPGSDDDLSVNYTPQDDIDDIVVPQPPPPTAAEVPTIVEPPPEPEPEPFIPPSYGFSTTHFMNPESFIDNDGIFSYRPTASALYYILDLPDTVQDSPRPEINITGDYDIISTSWCENNEFILFMVNERPYGGSAWFSFYVIFDIGGGQTLTRGGAITIVDDGARLVWNHDGSLDSFSESFSQIEHFMFDDDRSFTFKHFLIVEEGERTGTLLTPSPLRDNWPVFVPAAGTRTSDNAVTIRPINLEEFRSDNSLSGMWAISVNGWAVGDIVLTLNEQTYSLPVSFAPPEVGFSRRPTFTGLNDIISTFHFEPEENNNTFYYVLPTELNTRGLNRNNIEVLTREEIDIDSDFITAAWARNNRSVRFTVNSLPQSPIEIAFGLTNNAFGQIYGNIYHSSTWLEITAE